MNTAKQRAAAQLQALLNYRAQGKGDSSVDQMIRSIQVRYGWINSTKITINEPSKNVRKAYHNSKGEGRAIPTGATVW